MLKSGIIVSESNNYTYAMDLDQADQDVVKFEEGAAYFLKALQANKTEQEIITEILSNFSDCDEATIKSDFKSFMDKLKSLGFLA